MATISNCSSTCANKRKKQICEHGSYERSRTTRLGEPSVPLCATALHRHRRAAGTGPVGIGPGRTWAARRGGRRRRIPSRREQRGRRRRGALLAAAERHHPSESAALPFLHRCHRHFFGLIVLAGDYSRRENRNRRNGEYTENQA